MNDKAKTRILYIENDPALCKQFKAGLKPFGYRVDTSLNGTCGLALSSQYAYDLVAINYQLPDINGIEIARKLLAEFPQLPVLIVTGEGGEEIAFEALTLGVSNYVRKDGPGVYLKLIPALIDNLLKSVKEKRRTEQIAKELEESEKRFRGFAESAADFYWELDEDLKFTFLSDSYTELTGIPVQSLIGVSRMDATIPDIDEDVWNNHLNALRSHTAFKDFNHPRTHPEGRQIWLSTSGQPVFDSDGNFNGFRGIGRDITDQKQIEFTLLKNEKILKAALESIDGRAAIYDSEGKLLVYNSRYLAVPFKSAERLGTHLTFKQRVKKLVKGKFLADFGTSKKSWIETRLDLFEKGGRGKPELDICGRWYEPIFYKIEGGKTFVVSLDVTNLVEAKETAARSEKQFKEIAATTADRFWITDADHLFTFISGTGWKDTFVPTENVIGKTRWEVSGINPSNNEAWMKHKETLDAHLPFRNFTYLFDPSLRNPRYLSVNGNPQFDDDGKFTGYIGTAIDITDIRKVEIENQRLASAIDNLDILISLYDSDDRLVKANKIAKDAFTNSNARFEIGMTFEEVARGMVSLGLVDEAFGREEEWIKERLYLHEHMTTPIEVTREGGRSFIIRDQRLPDGSISSVAIDNTHLKEMEKKLRQSQRMEAIGQLTGGIAHDFNNLLGIIIGNAEMLEMRADFDESSLQNVKGIVKATDRAAALTERLLAFSRQQNLAPMTMKLDALLSNFEHLLNSTLGEAVNLHIAHDADLWPVMVDQNQFENAILNLAINARDSMPHGGNINIGLSNVVFKSGLRKNHHDIMPGDYVRVMVIDTGEGISEENLGKVFEPFFTTKEVGKGSGLGLSMVHGFIQQSNGHIFLESELGKGTQITIYLPRTTKNTKDGTRQDIQTITRSGTERILVVEDDENLRVIPVTALNEMGYDVDEAGSGDEALEMLDARKPYDLLFTDIVLPGKMNGIMIAEAFIKAQDSIKVIYTTGYADEVASNDQLLNINDKLLRKPYHLSQMLEMIRDALDEDFLGH